MLRLWAGVEANAGFFAISAILAGAIFAFDVAMPLGVAGGVPYVALVLLGLWSPGRGNVLALGFIASALTVLGLYLSPEGGTAWVVMTNRALALFAIWVTAIFICQRLRRREELNETTTLLTTTFATIAQGVSVFSADGKLVAFNRSYEEMFGFPPGFLRLGLPIGQIVRFRAEAGQFGDGDVEELVRARMERPTQVIEYTRERTLPTGLVYSMQRKPMPNGGYVSAFTDITAHRRTEQTAAEKSALLDTALQTMAQGFVVFDSDQRVVTYNEKYIEMSGLPAGCQPLGMSYEELLRLRAKEGKTARRITEDIIQKRLNNRLNDCGAISERARGDGTAFIYHRIPLPGGGIVLTYTDITERKRAEEKIREMNESLEEKIIERTAELNAAQEGLVRAERLAAVGQLTGGIAHDFNNLLAASLGNIELAEEAAQEGGDVRPFLGTIRRAGERVASLTSQLLSFSRKQTLFPQTADAGELVGGMTELLRSAMGETIEIKVASDEDLWPCEIDPSQFESAVLNLALNARDAMSNGGRLSIQTENVNLDDDYAAAQTEMEPGAYVLVAVTDTGGGMPQDVIEHAVDPFFTTKGVGEGSGLGLSMVYGLVKQSGGHVTIYSEEGEGTTVKLYLPRSHRAGKRPGHADQEDIPKAHGDTVLVVEDDPDLRTLSVALLRSFGYEILEAADAETALKALESAPRVNLLFTDVVLPGGMSGPELAAEVQSRFPGLPVLYTSGYAELANFDTSTFGENSQFLKKPYRKADLARNVRLVLDQARA